MKTLMPLLLLVNLLASPANAATFLYTYTGQPFGQAFNGQNKLPGATNLSATFTSNALLDPSTEYDVSSKIFSTMSLFDGIDLVTPGFGTFLSTSFLQTDSSGNISGWGIAELLGKNRSFTLGNQCCTTGDVPVLYTFNPNGHDGIGGSTDATIVTNGFFGIGPNTFYAYNNLAPGTWAVASVPEPVSWMMLLIGFSGMGAVLRYRRGCFNKVVGPTLSR